jgi:hypothetical protein
MSPARAYRSLMLRIGEASLARNSRHSAKYDSSLRVIYTMIFGLLGLMLVALVVVLTLK